MRSSRLAAMVCGAVWATGACGDGGASGGPDAVEITVTMTRAPALIAFRDGLDAAWQVPTTAGPNRYVLKVHGPYTVEIVCTRDATPVIVVEFARTPDDPREFAMPCDAPPSALTARVIGTMVQPGYVSLGRSNASGFFEGSWDFDMPSPEGVFDLIALSVGDLERIVIRRDQTVAGTTAITPPIDLTKEGVALVPMPVTITNLRPRDTAAAGFELRTRSSGFLFGDSRAVRVVPEALLRPGDTQYIEVNANDFDDDIQIFRSVRRLLVPGVSTEFTLPPVVDAQATVVDGRLLFDWGREAQDTLILAMSTFNATGAMTTLHFGELSVAYSMATGLTQTALSTDAPGFQDAWRIDLSRPYGYEVRTTGTGADETISFVSNRRTPEPAGASHGRRRWTRSPGSTSDE